MTFESYHCGCSSHKITFLCAKQLVQQIMQQMAFFDQKSTTANLLCSAEDARFQPNIVGFRAYFHDDSGFFAQTTPVQQMAQQWPLPGPYPPFRGGGQAERFAKKLDVFEKRR